MLKQRSEIRTRILVRWRQQRIKSLRDLAVLF